MIKEKAKLYNPKFKESAVKLANETRQLVAQTARELGVTKTTLYAWVNKMN